jgi:hypothetical protein
MRLPTKKTIDKMIVKSKRLWGMEEWEVVWKWGKAAYGGMVEYKCTEHRAEITLDRDVVKRMDRRELFRLVLHEVGVHPVLDPIGRGASDWADHYITDKKARASYDEMINSNENVVGDWIITRVMHE